jgi:plasmid replication initiation protein
MTVKSKNQVVVNNHMQEFSLHGLNIIEQKFWWALVSLIYNKGTDKLVFSRKKIELLALTSKGHLTNKEFIKRMTSMGQKIVSLHTSLYNDDGSVVIFAVFPTFIVDEDKITIKVSEYFAPWFNHITKSFSMFDLRFISEFKSSYTIELYRYLMRWRNAHSGTKYPGFWSVKWDRFKFLMSIPDNYSPSDIQRRILVPAKKELLSKNSLGIAPMRYLNIKVINQSGYKRKIDRIEFTFAANTEKDIRIDVTPKNDFDEMNNADNFGKLLDKINLYNLNDKYSEYFSSRFSAKSEIKKVYKQCSGKKDWTDMTFLVVLLTVIEYDRPITIWAFQDTHSGICSHRIIPKFNYPEHLYENLTDKERLEFDNFKNDGLPPSYFKK